MPNPTKTRNTKTDLILVGGGGHCYSCIDLIESCERFRILGIIDSKHALGTKILGYEIIGRDEDIPKFRTSVLNYCVTIGQIKDSLPRMNAFFHLKKLACQLPIVISPHAYVSPHSLLGEGTMVFHHALINAGVKVGLNNIINSKALIEHESIIGDFCHISTASVINGQCCVAKNSFIGSNAVLVQGAMVPEFTLVPAGHFYKTKNSH